jgi:hypothetical protein
MRRQGGVQNALCPEATLDSMPCSMVATTMIASMRGWKPTILTGRESESIRLPACSTTSVEVGKLHRQSGDEKNKEHFPCGMSGSDDSKSCHAIRSGSGWDRAPGVGHRAGDVELAFAMLDLLGGKA